MSTQISTITVIDKENIQKDIVSIENIANSFHGIKAIHFCNSANLSFVSVYTVNLGSVDVERLQTIQRNLGANKLSISTIGAYFKAEGLVYILTYNK